LTWRNSSSITFSSLIFADIARHYEFYDDLQHLFSSDSDGTFCHGHPAFKKLAVSYLRRHPAVHGGGNGDQQLSADNDTVNRFIRQMAKHARRDCLLTRLTDPLDDQFWPEPIRSYARKYVGREGKRIPEKYRFAKDWRPFVSRISLTAGVSSIYLTR
jgi:hypothetical protein